MNKNTLTIRDEKTGKTYKVETVRTAKDIFELIEGTEAEAVGELVDDIRTRIAESELMERI